MQPLRRPVHKKLPSKPSALIRLAVKDLELAEKAPNVVIDMGEWHTVEDNLCYVCFAGAVMRGFMEDNDSTNCFYAIPYKYNKGGQFDALNDFRRGLVRDGLEYLLIDYNRNKVRNRKVVDYCDDPKKFKKQMLAIADMLERNGL